MKWRKEVATSEEQGQWYSNKYREMKQCWHTPQEELDAHLDRMGLGHKSGRSRMLLEIGSGDGSFCLRALQREAVWTWGIELSEVAFDWAQEKRGGLMLEQYRHSHFMLGECSKVMAHFPEEAFDFICSIGSLEHVLTLDETLRQVARTLKPSGVFYNYAPNELWKHEDQPTELVATAEEWAEMYNKHGLVITLAARLGDNTAYVGGRLR